MKKAVSLTLCILFFLAIGKTAFGLDIQPIDARHNQYSLSCRIDEDSLLITGNCTFIYDNIFQENNYLLLSEAIHIQSLDISDYQRTGDTLTFPHHPSQITFCYSIPLADYRTAYARLLTAPENGCAGCPVRPRQVPRTVESDWDEKTRTLRESEAFKGEWRNG